MGTPSPTRRDVNSLPVRYYSGSSSSARGTNDPSRSEAVTGRDWALVLGDPENRNRPMAEPTTLPRIQVDYENLAPGGDLQGTMWDNRPPIGARVMTFDEAGTVMEGIVTGYVGIKVFVTPDWLTYAPYVEPEEEE
jgi:hypothetical protein